MSTKTLIKTISVGVGGAASIDFTSIPATFDDLVLELSARNASYRQVLIKFNGSAANFSLITLVGNGASPASSNYGAFGYNFIGYQPVDGTDTASVFGSLELYVPNYLSANYKSVSIDSVQENNAATAYASLTAGLWSQTAAINELTLLPYSGNFDQYSVASLYGIKNS